MFPTTPDEVENCAEMIQSNSSDNCVHNYNIEILNVLIQSCKLLTLNL